MRIFSSWPRTDYPNMLSLKHPYILQSTKYNINFSTGNCLWCHIIITISCQPNHGSLLFVWFPVHHVYPSNERKNRCFCRLMVGTLTRIASVRWFGSSWLPVNLYFLFIVELNYPVILHPPRAWGSCKPQAGSQTVLVRCVTSVILLLRAIAVPYTYIFFPVYSIQTAWTTRSGIISLIFYYS